MPKNYFFPAASMTMYRGNTYYEYDIHDDLNAYTLYNADEIAKRVEPIVRWEFWYKHKTIQAIINSALMNGLWTHVCAHLQNRILKWVYDTFSGRLASNPKERCFRLLEEVVEMCQVENLSRDDMIRVIDMVLAKPPGVRSQEVGGVAVCLLAYAESVDLNVGTELLRETDRVMRKTQEYFRERHAAKVKLNAAVTDESLSDTSMTAPLSIGSST